MELIIVMAIRIALAALTDGEPVAIPLGLTMKEADLQTPWREWATRVWVNS